MRVCVCVRVCGVGVESGEAYLGAVVQQSPESRGS